MTQKWTVGQEVGQTSGNIMRTLHKGRVIRVLPAGGCKVEFKNHYGPDYRRTFAPNGRQIPRSSVTSTLFPWSDDYQKKLDEQQAKRDRSKALAQAAAVEEKAEDDATREALAYTLELLKGKNDPRAERATQFITKWIGPVDQEKD